jgi:hypothetical protein
LSIFTPTFSYQWNQPTHQLTIFETPVGSPTFELARLTLNGNYGPNDFQLIDNTALPMTGGAVSENDNGTFVTPFQLDITTTQAAPCFARGALIATPDGERPVESLRIGDSVLTADGRSAPVRWIGHRLIDVRRHPNPRLVRPVCIRRGAFAEAAPHRDLLLSPDHAVFADGVLIPVKLLVNERSIVIADVEEVTYFHLELDQHEILLAQGLTVESLLPGADRSGFDNGGGPVRLHPDFHALAWEADGCAPLVLTGPALEAVRLRLEQRAELVALRFGSSAGNQMPAEIAAAG